MSLKLRRVETLGSPTFASKALTYPHNPIRCKVYTATPKNLGGFARVVLKSEPT
jgi:hypothetical protein